MASAMVQMEVEIILDKDHVFAVKATTDEPEGSESDVAYTIRGLVIVAGCASRQIAALLGTMSEADRKVQIHRQRGLIFDAAGLTEKADRVRAKVKDHADKAYTAQWDALDNALAIIKGGGVRPAKAKSAAEKVAAAAKALKLDEASLTALKTFKKALQKQIVAVDKAIAAKSRK